MSYTSPIYTDLARPLTAFFLLTIRAHGSREALNFEEAFIPNVESRADIERRLAQSQGSLHRNVAVQSEEGWGSAELRMSR